VIAKYGLPVIAHVAHLRRERVDTMYIHRSRPPPPAATSRHIRFLQQASLTRVFAKPLRLGTSAVTAPVIRTKGQTTSDRPVGRLNHAVVIESLAGVAPPVAPTACTGARIHPRRPDHMRWYIANARSSYWPVEDCR